MKIGEQLRFPTIPEDYESLIGLSARATSDHELLDLNRVLRRAGISMDRPGYLPRLDPNVLARLAPILGCTSEQITDRTMTVLTTKARTSQIVLGATKLNAHDIESHLRRISPLSIAAGSHHRESWLLRLLPYCPVSYELLRSDCSRCGAALRWKQSVGIGTCETCDQVVAPTDSPLLEITQRQDYTLFARLLSSQSVVRDAAMAELGPALGDVDGETLIRMVIGIGACVHLKSHFVDRKGIYRLPPEDLGAIVAIGTGMLREWPGRLQNWAHEQAAKLVVGDPAFLDLRAKLQRLGRRSLVSTCQSTIIREALPDIFGSVQRSFSPPQDTLLREEAGDILGVTERLIDLADAKLLPAEELGTGTIRRIRFRRSVVDNLKARMDGSISIPLLARTTGLPVYAIENLCDHGLLDRETDPALHYLRHASSITLISIERLRTDIFGRKDVVASEQAIPLATAARMIGGRLKPWTDVVIALRDQKLSCWLSPEATPDTPWLRSILVLPTDFVHFVELEIAAPLGSEYLPPDECSLTDAKEILNVQSTLSIDLNEVFADEIAARAQRGPKKSVPMTAVLARAANEISVAEVCGRTGWNPRQVKWALSKFDDVRTPCGWSRYEIEQSGVLSARVDWSIRAHRRVPNARPSSS